MGFLPVSTKDLDNNFTAILKFNKPRSHSKYCHHLQEPSRLILWLPFNSPPKSTLSQEKLLKDYANCVRTNGSKNDSARKLQNIKMLNGMPFIWYWLCVGLIGKLEIPFDKKIGRNWRKCEKVVHGIILIDIGNIASYEFCVDEHELLVLW